MIAFLIHWLRDGIFDWGMFATAIAFYALYDVMDLKKTLRDAANKALYTHKDTRKEEDM
jgi:hypothetical protein